MSRTSARAPRIEPASTEYMALAKALITGPAPICQGDNRFSSEQPKQRAQVLNLCKRCQYQPLCKSAGRSEKAGIWGGVDKTRKEVKTHE